MITYLIIASAWCFGIHFMADRWFGKYLDEKVPIWINKPLWKCPPCQSSVHGTIFYFSVVGLSIPLMNWPLFVVCLCGLNYFLTQFFNE